MTDKITPTQADIAAAWSLMEIAHDPCVGFDEFSQAFTLHAAQAREQAEQEHETFCKSWGMQKRMGVLEKELARAEAHRNSLMDKIQSQLTEIGALKAQISQAREEGARMMRDAAYQACLDCPSGMLNNRGAGAIAIRTIDPAEIMKAGGA